MLQFHDQEEQEEMLAYPVDIPRAVAQRRFSQQLAILTHTPFGKQRIHPLAGVRTKGR